MVWYQFLDCGERVRVAWMSEEGVLLGEAELLEGGTVWTIPRTPRPAADGDWLRIEKLDDGGTIQLQVDSPLITE